MSQNEQATIGNAGAIIERFGGIRPMASKINVPVTTIQGWKKRDAIPANRLAHIQEAAAMHNVNIADIVEKSQIANQNQSKPVFAAARAEMPASPSSVPPAAATPRFSVQTHGTVGASAPDKNAVRMSDAMSDMSYDDLVKKISAAERKAVAKSVMLSVVVLAMVAGAAFALLGPQIKPLMQGDKGGRIAALEAEIDRLTGTLASVRQEQNQLGQMIPKDVSAQLSALKEKVAAAGVAAAGMMGPYTGVLEQRLQKLEDNVNHVAGSPALANLAERFEILRTSVTGQEQINAAWNELTSMASQPTETLNAALEAARAQGTSLGQTLNDVAPEELQAGAMLFAMTQVRERLGRDNATQASDLETLKKFVSPEDTELTTALNNLAPLASQGGILTTEGLSREFTSLSQEIVTASLNGENVSIAERAKAKLSNVVQVEKNGEMISGTPAQATVAKVQKLLTEGDVVGAIAQAQALSGSAATTVAPWLQKANATLLAQQLKTKLMQVIDLQAHGRGGVTTANAPLVSNPADLYKPAQVTPVTP